MNTTKLFPALAIQYTIIVAIIFRITQLHNKFTKINNLSVTH